MDDTSLAIVGTVPRATTLIELTDGFPEWLPFRIHALNFEFLAFRGRLALLSKGPRRIQVGRHVFSFDVERIPLHCLLWLSSAERHAEGRIEFRASSLVELRDPPEGVPLTHLALELSMLCDLFTQVDL